MPLDADVKVTKALTPEVQAVADAREKVRELDAKVESAKLALKLVRDERETAFEDLTAAIDEMVNAERQPSLFPPGADAPEPPPGPDEPGPDAPAGGGEGEVVDAEYTVSTALVPAGEFGRAPAIAAGWRGMPVTEALEAHSRVFDALDTHGVETMGQLAARLKAGETFGLRLTDVEDLKEEVEQASCDDAEPVSFADELPKEAEPADDQEDEPEKKVVDIFNLPKPKRTRKPKAKKAKS